MKLPVALQRKVGSLVEDEPGPRLMAAGAGFFSTHWGFLPWSWGTEELDHFDVWEIE